MNDMTNARILVREMTEADLPGAQALSRKVHWPHRLEDWTFMLGAGFGFVAQRDYDIVGTALGWAHGPDAGTLGMVIVAADCRGGGLGRRLMDAVIGQLGERVILLNATEDGLALYKKLGFKAVGGVHQHQGTVHSAPIPYLRPGERVRPLVAGDQATIADLDHEASGWNRGDLFAALADTGQGVVLERDGEAVGFALLRRFGLGYAIGPVIAPDAHGAKVLITHWLGARAGSFIRLDVPYDSALPDWLESLGVPGVGRVITMSRGVLEPPRRTVAAFAIFSQSLG